MKMVKWSYSWLLSLRKRRYFSCLVDGQCPEVDGSGRRKAKYTVELPGYPILGDGKSAPPLKGFDILKHGVSHAF